MNYPQIKPTLNLDFSNTKTLDPRINFRRGTPGAYYDGKTYAKAEENLISYSEEISKIGGARVVVNDNSGVSPQGSQTASKVIMSSEYGWHDAYIHVIKPQKNNLTHSVYAKAGTGIPSVYFYSNDGGNRLAKFNLLTGEYIGHCGGQNYIPFDRYSIEDVGNDWYRIAVTILEPLWWEANRNYSVGLSKDTDDTIEESSSGTDFCYLWGAQFEQRDTVTSYTKTDGAPVTKYQPQLMFASPDQPRFDHDVLTGESKGLLIEESRTNLIRYSESFAVEPEMNYYFCTINDNRIIAPDGSLSSDEIIFDDGSSGGLSSGHREVVSDGEKYTLSIYAKAGNLSKLFFYFNVRETNEAVNIGNSGIKYDLSTNTVDEIVDTSDMFNSEHNILSVGNGWYRLSVTATMPSNAGFLGWALYNYEDNVAAGKNTAYIWGAQLEEGSFPTSYIKTSGASATRSADNASITGENFSSWYRQDEGSVYCEAAKRDVSYSVVPVSVDGGASDYIFLNLRSTESFEIKKNNSYQVSSLGFSNVDAETYHKIIGAYKKDNSAVSLNGINALTDTDCEIPAVNRLTIGSASGVSQNCHIKKLSYYPQRLTNEQLQQLTK